MLDALPGSLNGIYLGTDYGNATLFCDGKPLGTTLGYLYGLPLVTHDGIEIGLSEGSTEETAYGDLEGMFLGALQHLDLWIGSHLVHIMLQF